ncbi:hypothetical protein [Cellulosimicrobium sp. TH-20]|uniref:hypothetical protein n=1 Tax=Cellulosimicrobium sp. TH-20 TaxID=1980001 RepID=UPI0011A8B9E7|nr:hypothetical protein [Cellulosimicrobium sp. TH-20]
MLFPSPFRTELSDDHTTLTLTFSVAPADPEAPFKHVAVTLPIAAMEATDAPIAPADPTLEEVAA